MQQCRLGMPYVSMSVLECHSVTVLLAEYCIRCKLLLEIAALTTMPLHVCWSFAWCPPPCAQAQCRNDLSMATRGSNYHNNKL
jgi:hypothetical protein